MFTSGKKMNTTYPNILAIKIILKTDISASKVINTPENSTESISDVPKIAELTNLLPLSLVRYRLKIKYWNAYPVKYSVIKKQSKAGEVSSFYTWKLSYCS